MEDAAKYYCKNMALEESKRDEHYAALEFVLLSRLYTLKVNERKHYNWHVLVS